MSRILFAWELGGGFGHLGPFRPIADNILLARGREFALRHREPAVDTITERTAGRMEALARTKGKPE